MKKFGSRMWGMTLRKLHTKEESEKSMEVVMKKMLMKNKS